MRRLNTVDFFRGFFLVLMMIDHIQGPIKRITFQPFGYISAAEGFVFISGLVAGFVYPRKSSGSALPLIRPCVRRAFTLYVYQIVTFAVLLYAVLPFAANIPGRFADVLKKPFLGWSLIVTLLFRPGMFGILPAYIVFVLLVPVLTAILRKGHDRWLLAASFGLWLIGQFRPGHLIVNGLCPESLNLPVSRFEVLPWQFLFVIGFWLGYRIIHKKSFDITAKRPLVVFSILFALAAFLCRWKIIRWDFLWTGTFRVFVLGPSLGWIRLLDFLAVAYLVKLLVTRFPSFFRNRFLEFLGRHSLQVFCYHVVASYAQRIVRQKLLIESDLAVVALTAVVVASLAVPALIHAQFGFLMKKWRELPKPEGAKS